MALQTSHIPKDAKRIPLRPVALGEVTGHHHSFDCAGGAAVLEELVSMYEKDGEIYVHVSDSAVEEQEVVISHQEHKSLPVAPGDYKVTIQSEETDWGQEPVRD